MRDLVALPKAHLHVHLESAVRWETIAEIAAENGLSFPAHLADGHQFAGFADFFAQNDLVRGCLREPGDFRRIASEFCADQAAEGVRYAEVSFTAAGHGERLGDLAMPLAAVLDGLAEGQDAYDIRCAVILDHSRRRSVERAWRTLDLARRYADRGVIGIGLAGDEGFPATPFAEVFARARDAGLHVVHHAGEACGAPSIREAVWPGRAERLGHGIRILDDPDLVAEVRERGIPLEVCPSSNVALAFAPSWAAHPLPRMMAAGLQVTLNADIPSLVGTTLAREYEQAREVFRLDDAALATLALAGIDAAFAPAALRKRLHDEVGSWLAVS